MFSNIKIRPNCKGVSIVEVGSDMILILCVLVCFAFGSFLMTRLDKFLNENYETIEKESEKRVPDYIMLTEEMTDDEIVQEVKRFRELHEGSSVVIYGLTDLKISESMEDYIN